MYFFSLIVGGFSLSPQQVNNESASGFQSNRAGSIKAGTPKDITRHPLDHWPSWEYIGFLHLYFSLQIN
jgi:hypothetical protein